MVVDIALDGGIDLKKVMLAVLVIVAIMGVAAAANIGPVDSFSAATGRHSLQPYTYGFAPGTYNPYGTYRSTDNQEYNATFNFEQSVQGNGYFMTYKYAKVGNLEFKDYVHGSGSIDGSSTLFTQDLQRNTHAVGKDWEDFNQSCIRYEDNAMVYAPMRIAIGTGYYAVNPLAYDSLLKEKTWIKNYRAATTMHHEVEYAHALDKQLSVIGKEKFSYTYDPIWEGVGATQMKITEDMTDGKAHIGVLQGNTAPVTMTDPKGYSQFSTAWKKPSIEIDEDYFGTYHIEKNMTLEVPYKRTIASDDWLPCCTGGWATMDIHDSRYHGASAKGIFDCSCYTVPKVAEFQRVY